VEDRLKELSDANTENQADIKAIIQKTQDGVQESIDQIQARINHQDDIIAKIQDDTDHIQANIGDHKQEQQTQDNIKYIQTNIQGIRTDIEQIQKLMQEPIQQDSD
jgi:chromosome segregation ATPase